MQGTRVRSLIQEDATCHGATKPVRHNYWACALEPSCPRARAPQQEKPPQWEARALQLEKAHAQQRRPNAAKKKTNQKDWGKHWFSHFPVWPIQIHAWSPRFCGGTFPYALSFFLDSSDIPPPYWRPLSAVSMRLLLQCPPVSPSEPTVSPPQGQEHALSSQSSRWSSLQYAWGEGASTSFPPPGKWDSLHTPIFLQQSFSQNLSVSQLVIPLYSVQWIWGV